MKNVGLKLMDVVNMLLTALVSVLGFAACHEEEDDSVEYGCPYSDYVINGTVTDEGGTPISNIRVVVSDLSPDYTEEKADSMMKAGEMPPFAKTVRTDNNGRFVYTERNGYLNGQFAICLTDDDGAQNGGEFETTFISTFGAEKKQTKKGDNNWFEGEFTFNVETKMKKKN